MSTQRGRTPESVEITERGRERVETNGRMRRIRTCVQLETRSRERGQIRSARKTKDCRAKRSYAEFHEACARFTTSEGGEGATFSTFLPGKSAVTRSDGFQLCVNLPPL